MAMRTGRFRAILVLGAAILALTACGPLWLPRIGHFLIQEDELATADVVVVLAGDYSGGRVARGLELVRQGVAPLVLLNGSSSIFLETECRQAVDYAFSLGAEPTEAEPFCFEASSTLAESVLVDRELVRRGYRSAVVVTSDFHTRRSRMIFSQSASGNVEYRFAAAPTPGFNPDVWWRSRSGKKVVALEYLKLLNSTFERIG